ncbi:nucleotidyltransferase family protein [Paenibacillus chitinolyticus]|uniref:hypothetical protein n=1 Tax=Paenibacillus chitinolyticus TaxID=79263 RepID=UPI003639EE89
MKSERSKERRIALEMRPDLPLEEPLVRVMRQAARLLNGTGTGWLIGGSCALALQGVEIGAQPRDLDLYVDTDQAEAAARVLEPYAVDEQKLDRTGIYESLLSHYAIGGIQVELVGGFKVCAAGSQYIVEAAYLREKHAEVGQLEGESLALMPLAHELLFNILRERPDRYEAIARTINGCPSRHEAALTDLLSRNSWGDPALSVVKRLIPGL